MSVNQTVQGSGREDLEPNFHPRTTLIRPLHFSHAVC